MRLKLLLPSRLRTQHSRARRRRVWTVCRQLTLVRQGCWCS